MALRKPDASHTGEVTHLKNKAGRIFPVTDQLLKRDDMTPCDPPNTPAPKAVEGFALGKATKQQIQDQALDQFNVEISMKLTLAAMRDEYEALSNGTQQDEEDADSDTDADSGDADTGSDGAADDGGESGEGGHGPDEN